MKQLVSILHTVPIAYYSCTRRLLALGFCAGVWSVDAYDDPSMLRIVFIPMLICLPSFDWITISLRKPAAVLRRNERAYGNAGSKAVQQKDSKFGMGAEERVVYIG